MNEVLCKVLGRSYQGSRCVRKNRYFPNDCILGNLDLAKGLDNGKFYLPKIPENFCPKFPAQIFTKT